LAAAAAVAACVIALAGCGGGDDGASPATTTTAQQQAPTTPTTGQFRPDKTPTATTPTAPSSARPGRERAQRLLSPFYDCLSRHGVEPVPLNGSGARRDQLRDPAQFRKEIGARIACIPELPPKLQKAAERLKRRYEQRQG
jgi:hypothetical protein